MTIYKERKKEREYSLALYYSSIFNRRNKRKDTYIFYLNFKNSFCNFYFKFMCVCVCIEHGE